MWRALQGCGRDGLSGAIKTCRGLRDGQAIRCDVLICVSFLNSVAWLARAFIGPAGLSARAEPYCSGALIRKDRSAGVRVRSLTLFGNRAIPHVLVAWATYRACSKERIAWKALCGATGSQMLAESQPN